MRECLIYEPYIKNEFLKLFWTKLALSREPCKIMQDGLETPAISSFQHFFQLERYISKSEITVDNFSYI